MVKLETDYKKLKLTKEEYDEYLLNLLSSMEGLLGEKIEFDYSCYKLNGGKIFSKGHWEDYNNSLLNRNKRLARTRLVFLQKYKNLMFTIQKNKRAPKDWRNFKTKPEDDNILGYWELFEYSKDDNNLEKLFESSTDVKGLLFNKSHIIGDCLLPHATRFQVERYENFVPLTNFANRANNKDAKGMWYFEEELLNWINNLCSNDKIFYRVTPIFYKDEIIPRAIVLEAKVIRKTESNITYTKKLKTTEFNVLIPNTQNNLEIYYGENNKMPKFKIKNL
ncbi:hypothetical protein [Gemella sanguinis]|jgi:hypothetical protein